MSKRGSSGDADDSRGRRRGRDDSDVPRSETGWLDDLKKAKKDTSDLGDLTSGGSDRWSKLGALGEGDDAKPAPPPPTGRRGRAEPDAGGRRRAPEEPPAARRAAPAPRDTGPVRDNTPPPPPRRARPESEMDGRDEPTRDAVRKLIGRRSRPEPEPEPERLIGRRARPEPESDRDGLIGRRARPEPESETGRRRAADFDPPARPADDEPRRRSSFLDRLTERPGSSGSSTRSRHDLPPADPPATTRGRLDPPAADPPGSLRGRLAFGRGDARPTIQPTTPPASPTRGATTSGAPTRAAAPGRADTTGTRGRHDLPATDEPRPAAPKLPPRGPVGSPVAPGMPGSPMPGSPMPGSPMPGSPIPGPPPMPGSPLPGPPPGPVRPTSPGSAGRSRAGLAAGVQAIRGARSEVRRQLREQQRLRMWTLITLVVAVVGALPFYFMLRAATRDPVITSLDALTVPGWAVVNKTDNITGSRWCLLDCRYRERTVESNRPITDTAKVYREALLSAGWIQMTSVPGCEPSQEKDSDHSCWRRDEFTLDLSVNEPACMSESLRKRPKIEASPSVVPSEGGQSPGATASPAAAEDTCLGSVVQIKVFNAIDDVRLRYSPEPSLGPEGGNLNDEDLSTPSAAPSP